MSLFTSHFPSLSQVSSLLLSVSLSLPPFTFPPSPFFSQTPKLPPLSIFPPLFPLSLGLSVSLFGEPELPAASLILFLLQLNGWRVIVYRDTACSPTSLAGLCLPSHLSLWLAFYQCFSWSGYCTWSGKTGQENYNNYY